MDSYPLPNPYAELDRALADIDARYGRIADAYRNTLATANRILNDYPSEHSKQPHSDDSHLNPDTDTNAR